MSKYILRLDDACEKRDINKWKRMEFLLDKYNIKPLVGVIPHCEDINMNIYNYDADFWYRVHRWINKGWSIAMHGYNHVYVTNDGGLNPVNKRSEFASLPFEKQCEKIKRGIEIFKEHSINPLIFFAPSHTYDINTLKALEQNSDIKIISDTIAIKPYKKYGFIFVPQQSGKVRKLPFDMVTFCYHPNTMIDKDFETLERFITKNYKSFIEFPMCSSDRKYSILDRILNYLYMRKHQ